MDYGFFEKWSRQFSLNYCFTNAAWYHVKTTIMVVSAPIYGVKYFVIINLTNFFKRVKVG